MVILLDTLSILLPATVLKNCLETPGLKPFSTSCTKWSYPVIVQLESFLIEIPWSSSLTVFLSFEDLLPHLTFTCLCFACGTVPLVFICDYRKCRRLSEPYFLSPCWMSPPFSMCGLPHMSFNFPVELSHLIFFWLSHNALSSTISLFIVSFYFIHYPSFL